MRIVIIGAGSGFGSRLSVDICSRETLRDATICLCDIHPGRLEQVTRFVERAIEAHNLPTTVESSTDRTELLPGADFVITSVSVGGPAYAGYPYKPEMLIPQKYGVDQAVGDTVGPGAVFRFLRTGPVHLQFFRDIERLCPEAYVLNHTNPMCMLTWLHSVATSVRNVGLCHGVQETAFSLAKYLDVPVEEMTYRVAGINHLAWFLDLRRGSEDLYPRLRQAMDDPEVYKQDTVRFEILRHFGYFPTETTVHDSEYMPYFRRTPEMMEQYGLAPKSVADEPWEREWMKYMKDDSPVGELQPSHEYTTGIMEAMLTNAAFRFNGNVMNHGGLITNLPANCCVEVPCMVDAYGVNPCRIGDLPPHLAALDRSNVAVQELAVRAVLDRDREAAFHACALDPLTAAILPLDKIRLMFEEMWEAEKELLLWFDPNHTGPLPETCAP
jgi:alpha-galactosidase